MGTFTHYLSISTCLIYLYLDFYKVLTKLCAPVNMLTWCNFMEIYAPAMPNILDSPKSSAFGVCSFQRPYGVHFLCAEGYEETKINGLKLLKF